MTVEEMTARINALYHKSQTEGLSEEEKKEQQSLRQAYVASVRANLRGQLDSISIVEQDGSVTNLGRKFGKGRKGKDGDKAGNPKKDTGMQGLSDNAGENGLQ